MGTSILRSSVAAAFPVFCSAAFGEAVFVSQLFCSPSSLNTAVGTTCTVELSGAAPPGGKEVMLESNNTLLPLPISSVTVPAGETSTTFTAAALTISSNQSATLTATAQNSVLVTWTASSDTAPATAPLTFGGGSLNQVSANFWSDLLSVTSEPIVFDTTSHAIETFVVYRLHSNYSSLALKQQNTGRLICWHFQDTECVIPRLQQHGG
jgi:hypothetical protein